MSDQIRAEDLFDPNLTNDIKKKFEELLATLNLTSDAAKALIAIDSQLAANTLNSSKDIAEASKLIAAGNKLINDETLNKIKTQKLALDALKQLQAEQKNATKVQEDATKATEKASKANEKMTGTINLLNAANRAMIKERNSITINSAEAQKRVDELNAAINRNVGTIKLNSSELERNRLSIGGYKDAILEASGASRLFGGALTEWGTRIRALGTILTGLRDQLKQNAEVTAENTVATEASKEAEILNTTATEANTVATETNLLLTKEQIAAKEADVVVTNAETSSTEKLTIARRALNAVTSVTGLIIIAAIAAAKLIYDNLTVTQAQKDQAEATKEAGETWLKYADAAGVSATKVSESVKQVILKELELEDARTKSLMTIAKLKAEAQTARTESEQENKTTNEKIIAIGKYIEAIRAVGEIEKEHAAAKAANAQVAVTGAGITVSREQLKELEESKAAYFEVIKETEKALLRATKRETTLKTAYFEETKKMRQEANKEEIESIRITATDKIGILEENRAKEIKLEKNKYDTEIENLKDKFKKDGILDGENSAQGAERQAAFDKDIEAKKKIHLSNIYNINKKAEDNTTKEFEDNYKKQIAIFNKFNDEMATASDSIIADDEKRQISQLETASKIRKRKASEDNEGRITEGKDPVESKRLLDAEILAIDFDYAEKSYKIYSDLAKKQSDLVNKQADDYAKGLNDTEKIQKIQLLNSGKTKEEITKEEHEKRIADLNLEITERHNLGLTALDQELEIQQIIADDKAEKHKEEMKRLSEEATQTIDFAEKSLQRKDELTGKQLDNDLAMRQRYILQDQQLASEGRLNTLAFDKAAEAKDELRKEQLAIKQQKDAKTIAFFKLLASAAEKEDPMKALGEALVTMGIAGAITGSYYDGTEDTGESGNVDSKGGKWAILHPNERVMTKAQNSMVGDLSNDELAKLAMGYNSGLLPKYITDNGIGSFAENALNSMMLQQFTEMNGKISSIERALKERPVSSMNIDKEGVISESRFKNGMTKVLRTKTPPPLNNF